MRDISSLDFTNWLSGEAAPLILRCLLDRIPVLIYGSDSEEVDNFAVNLVKYMPHRQEIVFWSDFATSEEYEMILAKESQDFDSARAIVRVPSLAIKQAFNNFGNYRGWLFSVPSSAGDLESFIEKIKRHKTPILVIKLGETLNVNLENIQGELDTSFESRLLKSISELATNSIEKIKRVLTKKIFDTTLSSQFSSSLLDLAVEKTNLKESLFNSELFLFVAASKRALLLLTRLNLIKDFNIDASISEKMLLDSIQYRGASADRILDYINAEWGFDFSHLIRKGRFSVFGDIIDGLWG